MIPQIGQYKSNKFLEYIKWDKDFRLKSLILRLKKYLENETREFRFMRHKNKKKRAIVPVEGKVLAFLFGTLDETDLDSVRQLATNQQKIKHVLNNSMTFIKDKPTKHY